MQFKPLYWQSEKALDELFSLFKTFYESELAKRGKGTAQKEIQFSDIHMPALADLDLPPPPKSTE